MVGDVLRNALCCIGRRGVVILQRNQQGERAFVDIEQCYSLHLSRP